jgi:hypothetical protein
LYFLKKYRSVKILTIKIEERNSLAKPAPISGYSISESTKQKITTSELYFLY